MTHNAASEIISLQVFTALCNYEEELGQFLNESGTDLMGLQTTLTQVETLGAILDFVLNNENILLQICHELQLKPKQIWQARMDLPGLGFALCDTA